METAYKNVFNDDVMMCKLCGDELPHQNCRPTLRQLNDAFRSDPALISTRALDQLLITHGVLSRGNAFVERAIQAIRTFSDFSKENDPWGEHDFGTFELDGECLSWKIDYYGLDLKTRSPEPRNPLLTRRVLTIYCDGED